jgi:hypothetical protein
MCRGNPAALHVKVGDRAAAQDLLLKLKEAR